MNTAACLFTFEPGPNRRDLSGSLPRQRLVPVRISDATPLQRRRSADDLLDSHPAEGPQSKNDSALPRAHEPPPLPPKAVFRKASLLDSQPSLIDPTGAPSMDDILELSNT